MFEVWRKYYGSYFFISNIKYIGIYIILHESLI